MTKPKKPGTVKLADGALTDIPAEELDDLQDPESVAVEEAMRTFGDIGANVKVYKEGPGGYKDLIFLFGCLPSEWLDSGLERLQAQYGKGRYRVHMKGNGGLLMINKAINIEGIPGKEPGAPQPVAQPATDTMATPIALALAEIARGQAAIAALIEKASAPAPVNPLQTLEGMKALAEIFKPAPVAPVAQSGGFMETINAAAKLLEISRGIGGKSGDGDDSTDYAMKRGIDLVTKMMDSHIEQRAGAAPAAIAAPVTAGALPAPAMQPEGENVMSKQEQRGLTMLRLQLEEANDAAESGMPAEAFVDEVYEMIPEDVVVMIGTDPEWFAVCVKNVPDCAKFKPWYDNARNRIVALALEDGLLTAPPESGSVAESPKADAQGNEHSGDNRAAGTGTKGDA